MESMLQRNSIRRVLIVVNDLNFFLSHRLNIAKFAKASGYDVTVACPKNGNIDLLFEEGLNFSKYEVQRGTKNFFADLFSIFQLLIIIFKVRPDVVHLVTAKPVIFGGIFSRLLRIPVIAAITGLGFVYSDDRLLARFLRIFMDAGYRIALKHDYCVSIFQNTENLSYFRRKKLLGKHFKLIRGSGTKLSDFSPNTKPQDTPPIVLMPCRMIETKGVLIFLEAARIVNKEKISAKFILAGQLDTGNPAAVSRDTLLQASASGGAEWIGHCTDIASLMAKSSIIVLPSFYNEGLPKTLIDAAAAGRAVITTDTPGCREAVIPEETGLLVKPRDAEDLALKIRQLLNDHHRRIQMGKAGRKLAEKEYSDTHIADQHISLYDMMISSKL